MKIYDIANQEFISVDNDAPPITSVDAITNRIAAVVGYFVVGFIYEAIKWLEESKISY
jgi:hypothetical protein